MLAMYTLRVSLLCLRWSRGQNYLRQVFCTVFSVIDKILIWVFNHLHIRDVVIRCYISWFYPHQSQNKILSRIQHFLVILENSWTFFYDCTKGVDQQYVIRMPLGYLFLRRESDLSIRKLDSLHCYRSLHAKTLERIGKIETADNFSPVLFSRLRFNLTRSLPCESTNILGLLWSIPYSSTFALAIWVWVAAYLLPHTLSISQIYAQREPTLYFALLESRMMTSVIAPLLLLKRKGGTDMYDPSNLSALNSILPYCIYQYWWLEEFVAPYIVAQMDRRHMNCQTHICGD